MASKKEVLFGDIAVEKGYLRPEQLQECLENQKAMAAMGVIQHLGEILVAKRYITRDQHRELLAEQQRRTGRHIVIGPYEILSKLGQGGMGAVYRAKVQRTGAVVALKVLPKQLSANTAFVERFHREAEIASGLDHPNIVTAIQSGESGGYHYFAMEYVDGENVFERLEREGVIPEDEALQIVRNVVLALQHAAGAGLVHRDIKPDNIFLSLEGAIKLGDMGLAREVAQEPASVTKTGVMMGTPYYVSPEQAQGDRDIDLRSDIYSLGATLYHMVTGEVPFEAESPIAVLTKHLSEELPWPADINPQLTDGVCMLIQKMMVKERADRYQEPLELIHDIDMVVRGREPESRVVDVGKSSIRRAVGPRTSGPPPAVRRAQRRQVRRRQSTHRDISLAGVRPSGRDTNWIFVGGGIGAGVLMLIIAAWLLLAGPAGGERRPPRRPPARRPAKSPRAVEPRGDQRRAAARKLLADARRYAAGSPSDRDGIMSRYRLIAVDYGDTDEGKQAVAEIRKLTERPVAAEPVTGPPRSFWGEREPSRPQTGRRVIYLEDFERGTAGWTGQVLTDARTGSRSLQLKAMPGNQYHPTGGTYFAPNGIKVDLQATFTFKYRAEPGLSGLRFQCYVKDPSGKTGNYGVDLGPSREWKTATIPASQLKGNTTAEADLSKGFTVTTVQVYGGQVGESGRCFIDDFEVYAPAAPAPQSPGRSIDLGPARVLWSEDFESGPAVKGWTGYPERRITCGGSRCARAAQLEPDNRWDAAVLTFAFYLIPGAKPNPEQVIYAADEDVHISFCYYLTGAGKVVIRARSNRLDLNLHNDIEKAVQGRWTPVVLRTMDFAFPWRADAVTERGDKFKQLAFSAGKPGEKGVTLVIDDFAITKGPPPKIVAAGGRPAAAPAPAAVPAQPAVRPASGGWQAIFNGRDLSGWRRLSGSVDVVDGAIVCREAADLFHEADWTEFDLECDIWIGGGAGGESAAGVSLGHYQGGRGMSRLTACVKYDGDIHVVSSGSKLWHSGPIVPMGKWARIRLEMTRRALKVHLNGKLLGTVNVSGLPLRPGGVYVYPHGSYTLKLKDVRARVTSRSR